MPIVARNKKLKEPRVKVADTAKTVEARLNEELAT
jgi:hypothetical protein